MLVLSRKHQEKIRIGEHITITVLKTKGKTVRLGIEAPAEVPVIRGELSFAGQELQWSAAAEVAEETEAAFGLGAEESPHVDRMRNHWPVESAKVDSTTRVSLQRIPREQLASSAVGGPAPLRALMTRRSVSA